MSEVINQETSAETSKAMGILLRLLADGRLKKDIAREIDYSRPAVSRYLLGSYGAEVGKIEAAILRRYDSRICPHDGEEKLPAHCQRIAFRPRPHGFPDAESLWLCCQTCPHKPAPIEGEKA